MKLILLITPLLFFACQTTAPPPATPADTYQSIAIGDTMKLPSGLRVVVRKHGDGAQAASGKEVSVHYTGKLVGGKVFDSSVKRGEPIVFELGICRVIKGWDEGLTLLREGGKATVIIPPDLAYGERGAGEVIPPNATLLFEVELLKVAKAKVSIIEDLAAVMDTIGVDEMLTSYDQQRLDTNNDTRPHVLNTLGYFQLQRDQLPEALKIFKHNLDFYPEDWNCHDSYAEALSKSGDSENALAHYRRSLELNPGNDNAKTMISEIETKLKSESDTAPNSD